jgi:phosphoglycolate phosphatase-like HAD superfamily hydrolase
MHVCLFDIDGTLISSGGAGKAALELALFQEFGIERITDKLVLSGRTDRAICRDLFAYHVLDDTPENWRRLIDAYLQNLPHCLATKGGKVLPGITELLEGLRRHDDVRVGLLTGNIRAGAKVKLGHFGLYEHFAFGGFGDDHFDRDDVAREALQAVHVHCKGMACADRIWVIGDTPLDIRCARAIGARAVAVATGWHPAEELSACEPDLLFTDLSDPKLLLELLV